jgi:hypothetical protein
MINYGRNIVGRFLDESPNPVDIQFSIQKDLTYKIRFTSLPMSAVIDCDCIVSHLCQHPQFILEIFLQAPEAVRKDYHRFWDVLSLVETSQHRDSGNPALFGHKIHMH